MPPSQGSSEKPASHPKRTIANAHPALNEHRALKPAWPDAQARWELSRLSPHSLPFAETASSAAFQATPGDAAATSRNCHGAPPVSEQPLRLLASLRASLQAERKRGLEGHWTYDLSRHDQLLALYRKLLRQHLACSS